MNTIIDYVDWRGDLTLKQSPFNEIDAVIFTQLAYIDFSEIVNSDFSKPIFLKDVAVQIENSENFDQRVNFGPLINSEIVTLLKKTKSTVLIYGKKAIIKILILLKILFHKSF